MSKAMTMSESALTKYFDVVPGKWPSNRTTCPFALGLGFVVGRIYQIRRDELERRAEPPLTAHIPPP